MKLIPFLAIAFVFVACKKDKTEPYTPTPGECFEEKSYQYNIRPIIESSCKTGQGAGTGCHDSWIDDYNNVKAYLDAGTWQVEVLVDHTMPVMPNTLGIDSLKDYELEAMQCWINQGYPDN